MVPDGRHSRGVEATATGVTTLHYAACVRTRREESKFTEARLDPQFSISSTTAPESTVPNGFPLDLCCGYCFSFFLQAINALERVLDIEPTNIDVCARVDISI